MEISPGEAPPNWNQFHRIWKNSNSSIQMTQNLELFGNPVPDQEKLQQKFIDRLVQQ
jgi:hypothetical protein